MSLDEEMEKYRLQLEALERRESDQYKIGYLTRAVNDLSVFIKEHMDKEERESKALHKELNKINMRIVIVAVIAAAGTAGIPLEGVLDVLKVIFGFGII